MDKRKKSILIALAIGDGSLYEKHKEMKKRVVSLEIQHGYKQKEYIEWKADLCRKATGTLCKINVKEFKGKTINGVTLSDTYGYRFSSVSRYYKVLRKWIYPNNKKKLSIKYLKYLDAMGIAIWYMDDGSTYIDKRPFKKFQGSCEFSLHSTEEEAKEVITYFKEYWGLDFYLHKRKESQYNVRCYNDTAIKFMDLIRPYVVNCLQYKVTIPECYVHERETCEESHEDIV